MSPSVQMTLIPTLAKGSRTPEAVRKLKYRTATMTASTGGISRTMSPRSKWFSSCVKRGVARQAHREPVRVPVYHVANGQHHRVVVFAGGHLDQDQRVLLVFRDKPVRYALAAQDPLPKAGGRPRRSPAARP